jgi:putative ATPase
MSTLLPFEEANKERPLADRIRPEVLEQVAGHNDVLKPSSFLRGLLEGRTITSLIFWGPPGCGKTTLARLVANKQKAHFELFSAVLGGVKEVRIIVAAAKERLAFSSRRTILFVDEIHRFNKGQQDAFLPHVEDGTITLMGATTENPSFALNSALLSRCRVVRLEGLEVHALEQILGRAMEDERVGLGGLDLEVTADGLKAVAVAADGDARRALNSLEELCFLAAERAVTLDSNFVAQVLAKPLLRHDRDGDAHYDVVSAFIKSMRGTDPDAALYYMARMLEVGEDPRFIFRRMIIFASEDVGNADPKALSMATSGLTAFQTVGMPEGRIILGQVCTYLAMAPKSNASYKAIDAALQVVRDMGTLPVPPSLRNAATKLQREMGHGKGYDCPHDHGGWVDADYLPTDLVGMRFYEPQDVGYEKHLRERLYALLALRGSRGREER